MGPLAELPEYIEELKESFNSKYIIGGDGFGLTQYTFYMIIAVVLLTTIVLIVARKLTLIPNNKFVSMVEYGYEFITKDVCKEAIGAGYKRHIPFLASLFFFILIANVMGLIPGVSTPTGSISITWALAIVSFCYFNYWGVKAKGGWGYIKSIAPKGIPGVMVPVIWFFEALSTCLRALTLAFRLYGNMFAGHMVLGIFAVLTSVFTSYAITNAEFLIGLPSIAWLAFLVVMYLLECLVAFLQAYVFTTLSAVYVSLATSEH